MWNENKIILDIVEMDAQYIHVRIKDNCTGQVFMATFVYAYNKIEERVPLWNALMRLNVASPWVVLGDFNNVMFANERLGKLVKDDEMLPFKSTVNACDLQDMHTTGSFFTWNNKQPSETRVFSCIDRVLVNGDWLNLWPDWNAHYQPEGYFDHCPCIISCGVRDEGKKKPFKFFNMWTKVNDFQLCVSKAWHSQVSGTPMFKLQLQADPTNVLLMDKERQGPKIDKNDWDQMCAIPTEEEIRKTVFSIPDDKSPGPDGYTSCFFKASWDIIKGDICLAVKDFFEHGRLLKQLNSTTLVLIPKVDNPRSVKEFRPIACCNTLYKVISKLLCQRISGSLPQIINPAQCAFIQGRSILGNILISQDLVRLLLSVAGDLPGFHFHPFYKNHKLNHLMFADDLLLFCKGDVRSICIIMEVFKRFSIASGLHINSDKSDFYCNVMAPATVQKVLQGCLRELEVGTTRKSLMPEGLS
ncbi:uncharacterized protein LOC141619833 [Silene latifolia]|uniref:uncharacterized protein LOC141619833 n=1 Tax=Silene latifolia TaxID=37657 RepID=UPI003D76EAB7